MKAVVTSLVVAVFLGSTGNRAYGQRACAGGAGGGTMATSGASGVISPSSFISTSNAAQQAYWQQMAYQQQMQQLYLQNQYLQNQLYQQQLAANEQAQQNLDRKLAARQERREAEEARRTSAKARKNSTSLAAQ